MDSKKKQKFLSGPDLIELAAKEPRKTRTRDFVPAMKLLREKGYSWRECSAWLAEHAGVKVHHTHLLRIAEDPEGFDGEHE